MYDKILLSQILDKLEISAKNDKIEYTDFLDMYQVVLVKNFLKKLEIKNYQFYGGFKESERKIVIFYTDKYDEEMIKRKL